MRALHACLAVLAVACDLGPGGDEGVDTDGLVVDDGPLALPPDLIPQGDAFMVVVIPDTQIYAQRFPETFDSQLRWIADKADLYNIVFVTHVGDIVNDPENAAQWQVARAAYDWLEDIDMPHGFSVASHDTSKGPGEFDHPHDSSCSPFPNKDCDSIDYLRNFGPERHAGRPWFGGASPSGISSYQVVEAGSLKLLFLHLPQDTPRAEVDWAHEVLDANPGTLAHLTTHRYLYDYRLTDALPAPLNLFKAGRFNEATYLLGGQDLTYLTGLKTEDLFDELVAAHPNIWGVHCGHVDAEFRRRGVNDAGLPVQEVLVDFQDMADGGGGWMRLLLFRPSADEVEAVTFSTLTGELRRNGDGYDHAVDILDAYSGFAADILGTFGITEDDVRDLLAKARGDTPEREAYRASLYDAGERDSRFVMSVDFQAYIDASR